MANKSRLLYLFKYLFDYTDEENTISSVELRSVLEEKGFKADNRTIRDDVDMLRESGVDIGVIERNGVPTRYFYGKREWEPAELKIMIDALSSCQFISTEKSADLIRRLAGHAGISVRDKMLPNMFVAQRRKADSDKLLSVLQCINDAIRDDRKIEFRYFSYDLRKEKVYRHKGEKYVVSPYATVWMQDRYYLVGYSDKRNRVVTFRIDRIATPRCLERQREPEPASFSIRDYSESVFRMYDGPRSMVTLRCNRGLVDQIIDRFGKDISLDNITDETFDITAEVAVSGPFFAWLLQYAGEMTILGPDEVREEYAVRLGKALESLQSK